MTSNTQVNTMEHLPSGLRVCCTIPDIFYLPELVFGGLVWVLVACTQVVPENPQGWVMMVSVFCFVFTFLWMMMFTCGCHSNKSSWAAADFVYHFIATVFYLSASVALAKVTLDMRDNGRLQDYQLDISAVVFSYATTLLYFVHTLLSAVRWKSF
ncbi:myelin and lymphocyte protein-like [Entelurus aequoreus]|uniref:myelin and lymphocyte protein-like n=1 Tax=Entelurus aequoreus TaxID=161455 RepID=UPI002B1DF79E|nr:myelin and lymphocyte protein-like [Entelurus aequoreus]XP_061889063.1 myelin and lymphocyte protein-like [Entelurus aequoreus]